MEINEHDKCRRREKFGNLFSDGRRRLVKHSDNRLVWKPPKCVASSHPNMTREAERAKERAYEDRSPDDEFIPPAVETYKCLG